MELLEIELPFKIKLNYVTVSKESFFKLVKLKSDRRITLLQGLLSSLTSLETYEFSILFVEFLSPFFKSF